MLSQLLDKYNLKYEDLNPAERETLNNWMNTLSSRQLSLQDVKDYTAQLIVAVEREIAEIRESTSLWTFLFGWKKDFYAKARLKNYLMLQDFLTSPDRAQKYIEQSLNNLKK
jgi:hypothetical protein